MATPTSQAPTTGRLRIEVWADVGCPWCYLGKHRLERAIAGSAHRDDIDLVLRSYELDPTLPVEARPVLEYLADKMGLTREEAAELDAGVAAMARAEGLPYTADRTHANSFDAHRVLHLAATSGQGVALLTVLQRELFSGRTDVYDHDHLVDAAAGLGVARDRTTAVLAGDGFADDVRRDIAAAARLGVRGVPFAVLGGRYGIPGATSVEGYAGGIEQAWAATRAGGA